MKTLEEIEKEYPDSHGEVLAELLKEMRIECEKSARAWKLQRIFNVVVGIIVSVICLICLM